MRIHAQLCVWRLLKLSSSIHETLTHKSTAYGTLLLFTFTSSRLRSTFSLWSWFVWPAWLSELNECNTLVVSPGEQGLQGLLCMEQRDGEMLNSSDSCIWHNPEKDPPTHTNTHRRTHTHSYTNTDVSNHHALPPCLYFPNWAFVGRSVNSVLPLSESW